MRSDHKNEPAQDGKTGAVPPSSSSPGLCRRGGMGGVGFSTINRIVHDLSGFLPHQSPCD
jgi:hypothetical protein